MAFFRKDPQQVAEKLVAKGRIEAAIKEYRKLLEKHPDDPAVLNRIGDLYVRQRKSSEAADYYQQTAQQYASDGFYVKAIAVYKKIHRIEPSRHEVLLRLAELYERQGLVNDARAHYTQLAEHYSRQEDHRSAVETYQRMVDLEPENLGNRLKLADAYRQLGRLDETLRVYLDLGRLMVKHGRADHAVQIYERAVELAPDDLGFLRDAVEVLRHAGELEAAYGLIGVAETANPQAAELRVSITAEPEVEAEPAIELGVPAEGLDAEPRGAVVELEAEEDGLEGWQAVPEAMVGVGQDDSAAVGYDHTSELDREPIGAVGEEGEVPEDGLWQISGSWSLSDEPSQELEIDLDPLEGLSKSAAPAVEAEEPEVPEPQPLASGPATVEPDRRRLDRENDLIAEADVFLKYGLSQKAVERLDELLALNPTSMGAIERLAAARLERGEEQAVIDLARRVRSGELGAGEESWRRFEDLVAEAGYRIDGDRLLALDTGARPSVATEEEVSAQLPAATEEPVFTAWDEAPESAAADEVASVAPPLGELELIAPAAREFGSDGSDKLADADLLDSRADELVATSWLEDEPAVDEGVGERIFEEERQFFDLANELRPELEKEVGDAVERADEQSIDEIVEGFKRGVAENIAEEDSDTHYNLGIAYREMMLIDEAIGEFQIAAKSPDHRADACAMLGQCYRDKGMGDLAVKWYQRALETSNLEHIQRAGVLYELGQTFEAMNDRESAYYTYLELRGIDGSFRDVRERIEALQ